MNNKVITRFPPSPTGYFHIGSARTALFNYLFAKHAGGSIVLRFEDTDKERSKKEFEDDIIDGLAWLGIDCDMPDTPRQSERGHIYKDHIAKLLERGAAYEAEEGLDKITNTGTGRKIVRFKNPNKSITFTDLIRGEVTFDTTELADFVIAKNVDEPLYHLAVVIDDHEMSVTHVIRGEDHISNTPRQILILEALGFARPTYAHMPLILAPDKTKLSKRHGAVSVNEYRAMGYVPEALVNYLALLGWNPGTEQELFTIGELVKAFSIDKVQKSGAVFDIKKLQWFNHQYLRACTKEEFDSRLRVFLQNHNEKIPPYLFDIVGELQMRAQTLGDAAEALRAGEFSFMEKDITVDPLLLVQGAKTDTESIKKHLAVIKEMIGALPADKVTAEAAKELIFPYASEVGRAAVLWPLRVALSGKEKSPDPFILLGLLGKDVSIARIAQASQLL